MKKHVLLLLLSAGVGFFLGASGILLPFNPLRSCEVYTLQPAFDTSQRRRCYVENLVDMVRRSGLSKTARTLRAYRMTPEGALLDGQRCHALAHEIGAVAVQKGSSASEILRECVGMCNQSGATEPIEGLDFGCFNGAAHSWILKQRNVSSVYSLCNQPGVSEETKEACYHGIGHGLIELLAGDKMKAVALCETLSKPQARYQCAHAAFMAPIFDGQRQLMPIDIVDYCRNRDPAVQPSCFEFAGHITYLRENNIAQAYSVCEQIAMEINDACFERVGEAVFLMHGAYPPQLFAACQAYPGYQNWCLHGVIRGSIDSTNDSVGQATKNICLQAPVSLRNECFTQLGKFMGFRYGTVQKERLCSSLFVDSQMHACLFGGDDAQ